MRHNFADRIADALEAQISAAAVIQWPSARYQANPVGFCTEILGMTLTDQQRDICAIVLGHKRTAIRAGRKVGKTELAAALALWFYCSFERSSVYLVAPTERQSENIIWAAVRRIAITARMPVGTPALKLESGLKDPNTFRVITGLTVKHQTDAVGYGGAALMYIVDDAVGVGDHVFKAIIGNQAADEDCKIISIANPTRTDGYFAECFDGRRHASLWHQVHMSSLDSPNVIAGRTVVRGLASRAWVEEQRQAYGEDSPGYRADVLGEFSYNEQGKVVNYALVRAARDRYAETPADGVLHVGIDPAGAGSEGDESAFAVRRGNKLIAVRTYRGLTVDAIWETLRAILHEFRLPGEVPVVCADVGGAVGEPVGAKLGGIANTAGRERGFAFIGVRANERARREPLRFGYVSDELWNAAYSWLLNGGAIPDGPEGDNLAGELNVPSWYTQQGRARVTPKTEMRKVLGRSPDCCDALALSVWPTVMQIENATPEEPVDDWDEIRDPYDQHHSEIAAMNPYAAIDEWERKR